MASACDGADSLDEMRGKQRFKRFVHSLHTVCKQVLPTVFVQRCLRLQHNCTLVSFMKLSQVEIDALFHLVGEELRHHVRQRKHSIHALTSDLNEAIDADDYADSQELLNAIEELNNPVFASEEEDLTEVIMISDSDSDSSKNKIPSPRLLRSATKSMAASAPSVGRNLVFEDKTSEKLSAIPLPATKSKAASSTSTALHVDSVDVTKKRPATASSANLRRMKIRADRVNLSSDSSDSDIKTSHAASLPMKNARMEAAASALLTLPRQKQQQKTAAVNAVSVSVCALVAEVKTPNTFTVDLKFSARNYHEAKDWLLHAFGQAHHGGHPICRNSK